MKYARISCSYLFVTASIEIIEIIEVTFEEHSSHCQGMIKIHSPSLLSRTVMHRTKQIMSLIVCLCLADLQQHEYKRRAAIMAQTRRYVTRVVTCTVQGCSLPRRLQHSCRGVTTCSHHVEWRANKTNKECRHQALHASLCFCYIAKSPYHVRVIFCWKQINGTIIIWNLHVHSFPLSCLNFWRWWFNVVMRQCGN